MPGWLVPAIMTAVGAIASDQAAKRRSKQQQVTTQRNITEMRTFRLPSGAVVRVPQVVGSTTTGSITGPSTSPWAGIADAASLGAMLYEPGSSGLDSQSLVEKYSKMPQAMYPEPNIPGWTPQDDGWT